MILIAADLSSLIAYRQAYRNQGEITQYPIPFPKVCPKRNFPRKEKSFPFLPCPKWKTLREDPNPLEIPKGPIKSGFVNSGPRGTELGPRAGICPGLSNSFGPNRPANSRDPMPFWNNPGPIQGLWTRKKEKGNQGVEPAWEDKVPFAPASWNWLATAKNLAPHLSSLPTNMRWSAPAISKMILTQLPMPTSSSKRLSRILTSNGI